MNKLKIVLMAIVIILIASSFSGYIVYFIRGNLNNLSLGEEFYSGIGKADSQKPQDADVRIMSANLLVHYKSWGGEPAKPRAAMLMEVLKTYEPDVIGLQELSDEWFCCVNRNLPKQYKLLHPFLTGVFVNMTALAYNNDTLELIESGNFSYKDKDNPRLRRLVWGLFEIKDSKERFIASSTHFDLIREGREDEMLRLMNSQADEMTEVLNDLGKKYECPIFAVGDYNTSAKDSKFEAPEIYNKLASSFSVAKNEALMQRAGANEGLDEFIPDHIFYEGKADILRYELLSHDFLKDMSDHYPIMIDISIE